MSNKPKVYIPNGAKININTKPMEKPEVEYNKRAVKFDLKQTKKITGGKYGREARYKQP
jgi:hypothetical protein